MNLKQSFINAEIYPVDPVNLRPKALTIPVFEIVRSFTQQR